MIDEIWNELIKDTYTVEHIKKRLKALRLKLENEFFHAQKTEEQVPESEWAQNLPESFLNHFTPQNITENFSSLEKKLNEAKHLTLYLAFVPEEKEVTEIGKKVRNDFFKDMLIEIKLDLSLIGGCALIWNGVYKDYSLKSQINEHKKQIMESFKGYLAS